MESPGQPRRATRVDRSSPGDPNAPDTVDAGTLRVAIVEDDLRTRTILEELIDGTEGMRCVGSFGSAERALRSDLERDPTVLLLDVGLPGINGAEAAPLLVAHWPSTAIVMLTAHADDGMVFRAICGGARGYLLKHTSADGIVEAIRAAAEGGAPITPSVAIRVVELFRRAVPTAPTTALTVQETRLLSLLAEGHSYASAGDEMGVSINTVRNHIRSVYEKLHVHSKSAAVSSALRSGLI